MLEPNHYSIDELVVIYSIFYEFLSWFNSCVVFAALRKTMVRAHRQAWAWQDEWFGLTMEDIRQIEKQTQEALKMTMGGRLLCQSVRHTGVPGTFYTQGKS